MNNKKEIVDKTYYILGEDQSSTVFDKEGAVVPKINSTIDKICRCNVTNIITQQKIRWWILDFLYEDRTITIPKVKKSLNDIDVNSTSIILDTLDGLPERWYLEIDWNIINYGSLDTVDGAVVQVSGINWDHKANADVHFAYAFSENIMKPSDFFDIQYNEILKFIDYREKRPDYFRCYTIKPYKWKKVAVFYNIDNAPVMISYTKKIEPMVSDEDECWLPDDYGVKIVPYIVAWELLIDTSESGKAKELLTMWYAELEDMYSYYATPTKQFRKKIKTTPLTHHLY